MPVEPACPVHAKGKVFLKRAHGVHMQSTHKNRKGPRPVQSPGPSKAVPKSHAQSSECPCMFSHGMYGEV